MKRYILIATRTLGVYTTNEISPKIRRRINEDNAYRVIDLQEMTVKTPTFLDAHKIIDLDETDKNQTT